MPHRNQTPAQLAAQAKLAARFTQFPPTARRVMLTLCEHGAMTDEQLANHVGTGCAGHARALLDAGLVERVGVAQLVVLTQEGKRLADAFNATQATGTEDAR